MKTELKAYKISLEIINYIESLLIKRINNNFPIFNHDISFSKKIDPLPLGIHEIYNWFTKQLCWIFQTILKPILLTSYGLVSSIKKYYIVFTFIVLTFFFLIRAFVIDIFTDLQDIIYSEEIAFNILFSIFILVVLFNKIPAHGVKENKLLENITEKLLTYNLQETQWNLISDNIAVYKEYFNKRVIFINSLFLFVWTSYLLLFKTINSYLPKASDGSIEVFKNLSESFVYYLIVFAVIRSYTKVNRYIFEIIEISLNEVLFIQTENKTDL